MPDKLSEIAKGADSAVWAFLIDREYSVKDRFEDGATKAFTAWLLDHTDDIIDAVATKAAGAIHAEVPIEDVLPERAGALHIAYELAPHDRACPNCGSRVPGCAHPRFELNDASGRLVCMGCALHDHPGLYAAVNNLREVEESFANFLPDHSTETGPAWDYLRAMAQGAALLLAHEQF